MIRKFAGIPGFGIVQSVALMTILAGVATLHAQQTPAQQPPADQPQTQAPESQQPSSQESSSSQQSSSQQSSSQEASPEEIARERIAKTHNYKDWVFNVGGGASLTSGTTKEFVRSGGGVGAAGVARNVSKYLGLRLDFQ